VLSAISSGKPGYSRVEYARAVAAWTVSDYFDGAYAWDPLGEPDAVLTSFGPYAAASAAELSDEVKRAARLYGADLVGICRLNRRWLYSHERDGRLVEIPPEFSHAVVAAIAMDPSAIRSSPAFSSSAAVGVGYSRMAFAISCLAEFIRHLGYRAIPLGNTTALSIPLAIDAGLGELGRNGLLITAEYGACVRLCKVLTNMPLATDRPVSFGVQDLCRGCLRCADACEATAISRDPVPSYALACRSNNAGILRWAVNHDRCYAFWCDNGQDCATCIAACPFTPGGA
jgi:hypothetical protein